MQTVLSRRLAGPIYRHCQPFATPGTVVAFGVLWAAAAVCLLVLQARVSAVAPGTYVPDVVPFYKPQDLYLLLDRYGPLGRSAFCLFALYDVLYPLVAYTFATLALTFLLRSHLSSHPTWVTFLLIPPLGLLVELLEQLGFLLILASFPARLVPVAWATAVLSVSKLALLLGLLLAISFLLASHVWLAAHRLTRRCS